MSYKKMWTREKTGYLVFGITLGLAGLIVGILFATGVLSTSTTTTRPSTSEQVGKLTSTHTALRNLPTMNQKGQLNPNVLLAETAQAKSENKAEVDAAVDDTKIQTLFALECYWDVDTDNVCPPEITKGLKNGSIPIYQGPTSNTEAPYWFSNFGILGMIHHAEAYFQTAYGHLTTATVVDASRVPTYTSTLNYDGTTRTPSTEAGKFIIHIPNLYNRYQKGTGSDLGMHFLFNGDAGQDGRYSAIPWAKFLDSYQETRNTGGGQSYLTVNVDNSIRVYAMNQVMSYTSTENEGYRMILLLNMTTGRFLYKGGSQPESSASFEVVAGNGGFDDTTSTWKDGEYFARRFSGDRTTITWEACVDNKTQKVKGLTVDTCEDPEIITFFNAAENTFDPATFLGLNTTETTDLVNFLAFFTDATPLVRTEVPRGSSDAAYFPDTVTFT